MSLTKREIAKKVADKIVEMTAGKVDKKTANIMISAKRDELVNLILVGGEILLD